uniref:Integrase catalytic domain-containing protein n=1 Tax=Panagrolaimus sp. PS1159 TaxID=55785 RepID=A0AC35EZY3_9BILA
MADNHMDVDDVADNLVVEFVGGEDEEDPLEKAKKEFEELWKPAFIIFSKDKNKGGIKSDETYKGIVNAIKKKARGEEFTRNEKQEYNWSDRYPDGDYNFVLNYQDHFTKYCLLRPLKRKTAEAVAEELDGIFADFGPPNILQTDNGREFKNTKVNEICQNYGVEFIHGTPRHSQSQGSIERANRDVEDILQCMMADHESGNWVQFLRRTQLAKNKRSHTALNGRSPYEVMFGKNCTSQNPESEEKVVIVEDFQEECVVEAENETESASVPSNAVAVDEEELYEARQQTFEESRSQSQIAQERQADKMIANSHRRTEQIEVGQNVRIAIAEVDRAKCDPRNVLGIVTGKRNDLFEIGTKQGKFKRLFARSQIEPLKEPFMTSDDVPDAEISSVRTAAAAASVVGGQGHFHCDCKTACKTNRCKCKKESRLCNSRCHNSLSCCNK